MVRAPLDRTALEAYLTESDRPPPPGCSTFDTLLGVSVLRHCAPVLDLPGGADPDDYVARRCELGPEEVNRRLLRAAGVDAMLVDTGLGGEDLLGLEELARASGAHAREVVRLEAVAEEAGMGGTVPGDFADAFAEVLARRADRAVALKSIIAYRFGLDFDPRPPSAGEVAAAAEEWLGRPRLDHPVLLRHVLWAGLRTGLPLQIHTGFGDPDEDLRRSDPALLTDFLRATVDLGPPVMLLHCYPYHREAAYLASVFPHVHMDVGLAVPHVGHRSAAVLAEALELAPFYKVLYSSDAFGLPELHHLGAVQFRRALEELPGLLGIDTAEAERVTHLIAFGNARRVYALAAT